MRKPYLVLGTVTIYNVHVDPEHGTEYEQVTEYETKYTTDTYTPGDARWKAALQALGKHVKTGELEKDEALSLPHIGHGRYIILDGNILYAFQGIAFERASE